MMSSKARQQINNIHKNKYMMEEAQPQAKQIEDQGQQLDLWQRRFKRIGMLLLMAEKHSYICLKRP